MSRFLQFWCKLNTRRIVKNCRFCFLRNYYGDFLDLIFLQFPNHFLPFPMVFSHVSPSVSTISSGVSTVSSVFPPFPILDFAGCLDTNSKPSKQKKSKARPLITFLKLQIFSTRTLELYTSSMKQLLL